MSNDLQKAWDRFLIEGFYKYPYDSVQHAAAVFVAKNQISFEQFNTLKRIPKTFRHQKVTTVRFVCAFLPTIAKVLWQHRIDQLDSLAAAVSKLNSDAREIPVDEDKRNDEANEIARAKRQATKASRQKQAMGDLYEKHRRSSQWGVTK